MKRRERERQAQPRTTREVYGPPGKRHCRHGQLRVPVTLFREGEPLDPRVWGMVDTGANFSVLPWGLMGRLGLTEADLEPETFRTAVDGLGSAPVVRNVVEAEVQGVRVELLGVFSRNTTQIILGTEDCLQHFRIVMHLREGTVELEPSPLPPRPRVEPPPPGGPAITLPRVHVELPEAVR